MSSHDDRFPPPRPDRAAVPRRGGPRPDPPGAEYHRVLAGEKRRIGRGILAVVLLLAGLVVFPTVIIRGAALLDLQLGNTTPPLPGGTDYTPLHHAATMFSLALLVPWSMLIQRWLYGVRGASLHSVVSRFRFDVFGRAFLLLGPVWLLAVAALHVVPGEQVPWSHADLLGVVVVTLLLTPMQAAGEEYGLRGLVLRVAGSWARGPRAGLVVGVLVSSLLFTAIHGSTDSWIIVWYTVLGAGLALITWRTGGIEIAVVLHALLNTVTFVLVPLLRIDPIIDADARSAGAGSAVLLVPTLTLVVITAVVWWATRRSGPARTPDAVLQARPAPVTTG